MKTLKADELSPFGQLAMKLDASFRELERLGGQIERVELDSDSGLDRSVKLLTQYAEHGQGIAEGIQEFAKALQAEREGAEQSAQRVSERATQIQLRKEERLRLEEKIGELGLKVKALTGSLAGIKNPDELSEVDSRLGSFIEEANALQDTARESGFKSVEREAQSLSGSLQAVRRKLGTVLPERLR